MTTTRDIDAAKDRLVDSLSIARDAAVTAVRDDIAPAVAAAVEAARDASGPVYAEAASRAGDAVSALRGSDTVKNLQAKATGKHRRRRWPIVAAIIGIGAAGAAMMKRRSQATIDLTDSEPAPRSFDSASSAVPDSESDSA